MKKLLIVVFLFVMTVVNFTLGDNIRGVEIDFVTIGNPGNPGDIRTDANPYECGSVDYDYRIGKYEITNAQWETFVGIAGAPTGNPTDAYNTPAYWANSNQPTNELSWYEAAQFCNYLTSGDKSKGAYLFSGDNSNPGNFLSIDREVAQATWGTIYILPTEDE